MNRVQSKHRIQKCRRINYSSILMLKFPTSLASMDKIQYDFYLELNLARMISTKQKNVFTAIYEYRLHGTQRYVSQPQRRRREFAYKFQIQYRNIKRNNNKIPSNSILCSIRCKSREKQISVKQHAKFMALA